MLVYLHNFNGRESSLSKNILIVILLLSSVQLVNLEEHPFQIMVCVHEAVRGVRARGIVQLFVSLIFIRGKFIAR